MFSAADGEPDEKKQKTDVVDVTDGRFSFASLSRNQIVEVCLYLVTHTTFNFSIGKSIPIFTTPIYGKSTQHLILYLESIL